LRLDGAARPVARVAVRGIARATDLRHVVAIRG
jgi:hypothetical protein